ncbi:MAG: histidine kinase [Butyrivibrio sp.]|nr:histidine kinase [Butyrivibrio sp.]
MKKKLIILYLVFTIIPLAILDAVVIGGILRSEETKRYHEMENVASAVKFACSTEVDSAAKLANSIYTSKYIYDFLNMKFKSPLDYYDKYRDFFNDTLIGGLAAQNDLSYILYVDNDTMINGSQFRRLASAYDEPWYRFMKEKGLKSGLFFDYNTKTVGLDSNTRKIFFFKVLDYYDYGSENVLLIDIDYGKFSRVLMNMNYDLNAYVCDNEKILLTNGKGMSVAKPYENVSMLKNIGYTTDMQVYNQLLKIHVVDKYGEINNWWERWGAYLLALALLNIIFPILLIIRINRIAFSYKIREQAMIMTRQHAELLALHSQINPHFLFNALESIRMHSIIKKESETAYMIEKLAKLQRQYTEWDEDNTTIENEADFVSNYLELQKYRFGDRLSYAIEIDPDCVKYLIPKLTLVTFVENACIHGIESKTSNGWIFLRIHEKNKDLIIEIEDTGNGMSTEESEKLLTSMRGADISMLKKKGRVGVINACIRLKMVTEDKVLFDIDSEEGIGTIINITIPQEYLKRGV